MKKHFLILLSVCFLVFNGCSASLNTSRVSTAEGDKKGSSMTDNWLATDTTNAVNSILQTMHKHNGFQKYLAKFNGKQPKLFIAEIQNNTSEAYFPIQDLNDELLDNFSSTGEFILIDEGARNKILSEIKYQNDGMVDIKDIKNIGKQASADLMVFGTINMKPEVLENKTLKEYSVNVRMTDVETGIEVMRARYKVSKYSERSGYKW